ncbi:MAG: sulfurtransferase TusA family protein [Amylibacter sp.]|jgi:tRNA 2-thiouridine synthesizing protein A|tara:strand:- start:19109 stop:19336 length:228 start_codon:yes stop_codon:yes gene_type:complete
MDFDDTLDAMGTLCPMPVLKARKRLQAMQLGQILRVLADDPAAEIDFPHFCTEQGHQLIKIVALNNTKLFFIKKR